MRLKVHHLTLPWSFLRRWVFPDFSVFMKQRIGKLLRWISECSKKQIELARVERERVGVHRTGQEEGNWVRSSSAALERKKEHEGGTEEDCWAFMDSWIHALHCGCSYRCSSHGFCLLDIQSCNGKASSEAEDPLIAVAIFSPSIVRFFFFSPAM